MIYRLLADILVVIHLTFILFVGLGWILLIRWPRLLPVHVAAVAWGAVISVLQWTCPLTPLENRLRSLGGQAGYPGSFIDHYLLPVIYPAGLGPTEGRWIAAGLVAVNVGAWGWVLRGRRAPHG